MAQSASTGSWRADLAPLALLWLIVLPLALTSLVHPFGRDQGIYAYTAARFLDGAPLYSGIYAFKPPNTVFVHAASQLLFGHSMTAIRAFDVFWSLATVTALYAFVVRGFQNRSGGVFAGVVWALIYHALDFWTSCQTDGWVTLPLAIAFACVSGGRDDEKHRSGRYLAAGLALSVAIWFKYTFGAPLLWFALLPLWTQGKQGVKPLLALVGGVIVGSVAVLGLLGVMGSLPEFVATQLGVTLPYAGTKKAVTLATKWGWFTSMADNFGIAPWVTSIPGVGAIIATAAYSRNFRSPQLLAHLSILVWLLTAFVSCWVQGKFFLYHFLPFLAPLALFSTVWLGLVGEWVLSRWTEQTRWWSVLAFVAWIACTQFPFSGRLTVLSELANGDTTLAQQWQSTRYKTRDTSVSQSLRVGTWIRDHSAPGDRVYVWSYDPIILFLADRPIPTRFLYHYPLVVPWGNSHYRDELLSDLKADPPVVFGVGSKDSSPKVLGTPDDSQTSFTKFSALSTWVNENYAPAEKVGNFQLYLRK